MLENSLFNVFNLMIENSKKNYSKEENGGEVWTKNGVKSRFFVPQGGYAPMSAIIGAEINTFHGSDSLQLSAVYACVSKISDSIASMDMHVENRAPDGSIQPIYDHPVGYLMSVQPNPYMGAYEFWQMIISDALLYGIGYGYIHRPTGEVYWLPASDVSFSVDKSTGVKYYHYPNAPSYVPQDDILEIKSFRGLSPTRTQMKTLTKAKNIQDFGSKFFENGGMLGGILSTKEYLDPSQMKDATEYWKENYSGSENAHKIAILSGGFVYQPLSVPLEQLQFIESHNFSNEEIARMFQVPPEMIGIETGTTYNNYEQKVLQYVQGCILPWVKKIELEVTRKMLNSSKSLHARWDVESLLRADYTSKSSLYHSMLSDGVWSINEVRKKEGYPAIEGGDNHHVQINQIPVTSMDDYAKSIISSNSSVKAAGIDLQASPKNNEEEDENEE